MGHHAQSDKRCCACRLLPTCMHELGRHAHGGTVRRGARAVRSREKKKKSKAGKRRSGSRRTDEQRHVVVENSTS